MRKDIKTQSLSEVLTMTNTDSTNFISERNGKIYKTPFKEEYKVSNIEIDDVILFHDVISNEEGTNKILGIEYGELISPIIDPDNNPIYTERLAKDAGYSVIPLELGGIDPEDGDWLEWDSSAPYIRSAIYIPITPNEEYNFSCPSGTVLKLRVMLCDSAKRIIHDKWNNGVTNYKEINMNIPFSTTLTEARYLMFDVKSNADVSAEIRIDKILPPKYDYLTVHKVRMLDNYNVAITDSLEGNIKQLELSHDKPSSKIGIYALKAPTNRPLDVKLRLINAGVKTSQFVDIRSVRDNEEDSTRGRCEIGVRSFEKGTPVPEFAVGFANSINGDLIHKFIVDPDAMPIRLTSSGVQFRLNNAGNNTPGSNELKTINFGDMSTKVDKMYTSLIAHQLLVDQTLPEEVELVNIKAANVDYESDDFPTVAEALDFLIANNNYLDVTALENQMELLTGDMETLSKEVDILDKSVGSKIAELNGIVKTYESNINTAIDNSESALNIANELNDKVTTNETTIGTHTSDIASIKADLSATKESLSDKDRDLENQISDIRNNPNHPLNWMISKTNTGVTYISTNRTAIVGIPYSITYETVGVLDYTATIVSNMDNLITFKLVIDNIEQDITFKQTVRSGYNTVSMKFYIPSDVMEAGDHVVQIYATCDADTVIIDANSSNAILHLMQEVG